MIFITALVISPVSAYIYTEDVDGDLTVPVGGNTFLTARFENSTKLNQEGIRDANFTTANHTFPYSAAYKITYKNAEGKTDYLITWKCDDTDYLDDYIFNDYYGHYSGYLNDNTTPIFMYMEGDYVYGIILDCENITYTESDLVHEILAKSDYALSNESYEIEKAPAGGFSTHSHYGGVRTDPYEIAGNDPYSYYDYFDYEDNVDIDEYLYDNGYDE